MERKEKEKKKKAERESNPNINSPVHEFALASLRTCKIANANG